MHHSCLKLCLLVSKDIIKYTIKCNFCYVIIFVWWAVCTPNYDQMKTKIYISLISQACCTYKFTSNCRITKVIILLKIKSESNDNHMILWIRLCIHDSYNAIIWIIWIVKESRSPNLPRHLSWYIVPLVSCNRFIKTDMAWCRD